ncbi:MAG: corrinoid protein [Oscillospiraceae bacterium]|nr:corrinoid protein [Oscillospiraceae bacterium]
MSILNDISEALQKGRAKVVSQLVTQALEEGVAPADILNDGLLVGMNAVGEKFQKNEVFVPEVLIAARAMNAGSTVLKPYLAESGVEPLGRVCVGTVEGDLHDIGKNLVKMMLEGKGIEVIDLGIDVSAEKFVTTAIEQNCGVICCSALLTTTMNVMKDVVEKAKEMGVRDKVKIMVGGAPVTQSFCDQIGADAYTSDAASCADKAAEFLIAMRDGTAA